MGYCYILLTIFYKLQLSLFMKRSVHMTVSLDLEFEAPKLIKVKAHKRILNGKVVKVRSFYRRVEGRV